MQQFDTRAAQEWLLGLFSWREKRSGMIAPEERLPWGETMVMGLQHVLAMFGATVLAPILMGFDPNVAIFFSGIGTIIFFLITGGRIPSYLGSSFAFIGPVLAVTAAAGEDDIPRALGGIVIAGLVYTLIGFAVHYVGSGWIDNLMPPIVTGGVVAIIGLNLAGAARDMAEADIGLALLTILAILGVALLGQGVIGRLPILIGTTIGYLLALILGGTSPDGRQILGWNVTGVDFTGVWDAPFFGLPDFQTPTFDGSAIALIAPVAVVLVAENTGHIKAVSEMTRRNMMPFLGRGFIGDGVATMLSGFGGGTGVTTYAENIGVMAVTRVFSTAMFIVASGVAVVLGFSPKFGALINSIPLGVLGGVSIVLFGLIAAAGIRIWIDNRVDFSKGINLFIASVTLIVGASDLTLTLGNFDLNGIALGTFGSIILYQIFRHAPGAVDEDPGATPASAGEPDLDDVDFIDRERRGSRGRRQQPTRERMALQQRPPQPEEPPRRRPPGPREERVLEPSDFEESQSRPQRRPAPQDRDSWPPARRPQSRRPQEGQAPPSRREGSDRPERGTGRMYDDEPQMPPPPMIPPPPTRRQRRPTSGTQYDDIGGEEIVIDDPSAMPRGRSMRPSRRGDYDFLQDGPPQVSPRRPRRPQRPAEDEWDDDYGYEDDEPVDPGDRRQ